MPEINYADHNLIATRLESIRGERVLFRHLDLQLKSGQAIRIQGENGAGKTTLLRILTGIGFASEGEILWNDKKISLIRESYHSSLHYLGHEASIKMALTPLENLSFFQSLHNQPTNENAVMLALKNFGLLKQMELPCSALSAGQKRRVALCRLLLVAKPLWILDEPFTALDDQRIEFLESKMLEHIQRKGLLLMTTHQPIRNKQLQYRSLVLQGGKES